ncbi:MAG: sel1 repeat family protein [Rhodospirillales bacterium]|nr:sel1 repeat family protein [Acetobacter sp.]
MPHPNIRRWPPCWLTVIAFGCLAGVSQAQTTPAAPSPDAALITLQAAATNGNAAAQAALGGMYFDGQGVVQDHPKALPWNQKAAAQNRPDALLRLGMAYYYPSGSADFNDPPQNSARARQYFGAAYAAAKPLADQGDPISLYVVGRLIYQNWYSSDLPFNQALDLIRQSADKGYAPAECYLGFNIRQKQPQDAKAWFVKAAVQDASCGMVGLGYSYEGENRPDLAQQWFTRAATLGSLEASRRLYSNYHVTVGDPKLDYLAGGRLNPHGDLGLPASEAGGDPTMRAVAGILGFSALATIYLPKADQATIDERWRLMQEDQRKSSCLATVSDRALRTAMNCY